MRAFQLFLVLAASSAPAADLAVVEKKAGAVGFYTAEGKRIGEAKVGRVPHEIIYSPDRRTLYVSDNGILWLTDPGEGGNTISMIDAATRRRTGVIDLGSNRRPHGMDVIAKSGHIVVTVENPAGLLLVDPAARKVLRRYDTKGDKPHMVLLDRKAEWAYVSNSGSATVAAINLATGSAKVLPVGENPQGAVATRDGKRIYMTVSGANSIIVLDAEKQTMIGRIAVGNGPARVALTADEKTLVYNGALTLGFADVAALKQTAEVALPGRPLSMTLSNDGERVYLGIQDSDKIVVASVAGRRIVRTFDTPKDAGPDPILELP